MNTKERKQLVELFKLILSDSNGVSEEVYMKMVELTLGKNKPTKECLELFSKTETKTKVRYVLIKD